jgi:putative ABC transport system permease protein
MFRNYLRIALRYLMRYKAYTAINILGLAVGITCCVLIMLFVRSEFSYDKFNKKADRIFRVWQREKEQGQENINTVTPIPAGPAIAAAFPSVEATCRVFQFNTLVKVGNISFDETITMADSTLFHLFDFHLLQGSPDNPFPTNSSLILTPEMAKKYFGDANPVGKTFEIQ